MGLQRYAEYVIEILLVIFNARFESCCYLFSGQLLCRPNFHGTLLPNRRIFVCIIVIVFQPWRFQVISCWYDFFSKFIIFLSFLLNFPIQHALIVISDWWGLSRRRRYILSLAYSSYKKFVWYGRSWTSIIARALSKGYIIVFVICLACSRLLEHVFLKRIEKLRIVSKEHSLLLGSLTLLSLIQRGCLCWKGVMTLRSETRRTQRCCSPQEIVLWTVPPRYELLNLIPGHHRKHHEPWRGLPLLNLSKLLDKHLLLLLLCMLIKRMMVLMAISILYVLHVH